MTVLETILLALLLSALVTAGYTDCRTGQIQNRLILWTSGAAGVLDLAYYGFFAEDLLPLFLLNLLTVTVAAFFFYAYHLWAAGDSKLFFVVGLCIPGRFYTFWNIGSVPGFVILIFVFSIAFFYVVGESVVLGVRRRDLFRFSVGPVDYAGAVLSYFAMVAASILVNWGLWRAFPRRLERNPVLSVAVSFFVVLTLIQLRNRLSRRGLLAAAALGWAGVLLLIFCGQYSLRTGMDVHSWGIVLAVMCLRMIAEKYNYQTVPTSEIRSGQILSAASVMAFRSSRIQGLPTGMTEDLRSRLTAEEAESVRRWEHSRTGRPYVVIVRKIPFAVFIGVGTAAFLLLGVAMR